MYAHSLPPRSFQTVVATTTVLIACLCLPTAAPAQISPELLASYQPGLFQAGDPVSNDGGKLGYRMMAPAQIESGKKYPLVLFLHGAGERGSDNQKQLVHGAAEFAKPERRREFPAYVLFPQCPSDQRWVESDWDLPSGRDQFPDEPSVPMAQVLALVDSLVTELPIDPNRLYVTGLSMGGQGTWFAAVAPPKRFAAMLEVCGGGDPSWANRYTGTPVWALHGQADSVVPVSRGREMIIALTEAGHTPELRYVEYPGVGHNSWTRTYARDDVYRWLFSQRKP
ncbi:MAG: dienelactone hydrolase family protein [Rubripirellula sp.]